MYEQFDDYPEFVPEVENYVRPYCHYLNVECLSHYVNGIYLSILMLNIRSCCKNFDQFISTFGNYIKFFTCIILTETWLTQDRDNIFNIHGFYCTDLYRNNYGGGIKVYVKDHIQSKILDRFTIISDLCEMLTIELLYQNQRYLLTSIYHPPTPFPAKNIEFVEFFTLHLNQLIDLHIPLIIAGDLNINLLNPNNSAYVDMYVRNLFESGMKPIVTLPTKVNMENVITRFSIIDHIWISEGLNSECSLVIPIDITDHFPVVTVISSAMMREPGVIPRKRRKLVTGRRETFRIFLSNIHINLANSNINESYDDYFLKVFEGYNKAFPIDWYTPKDKQFVPWMTPRLRECIKKKAKLYRAYLKGQINKADYTTYKNRLTNILRKSKALYYAKVFLKNEKKC